MIYFIFLASLASVTYYLAFHWRNRTEFRLRSCSSLFASSGIVGESIHSICKHKIYELSNHGKNCFYRMMIRPQMDWRRLMNHFALRYMCLLRKYAKFLNQYHYMFHYRWHRTWEEWCEDGGYQSCFRPYERQMRIGLQAVTLCLLWRQDNYTLWFFHYIKKRGSKATAGWQDSNSKRHITPRGTPAILIISAFKSVRCLSWKLPWICFAVDGRWGYMRSMWLPIVGSPASNLWHVLEA